MDELYFSGKDSLKYLSRGIGTSKGMLVRNGLVGFRWWREFENKKKNFISL